MFILVFQPSSLPTHHGGRVAESERVRFVMVPPKTGFNSVAEKQTNYKLSSSRPLVRLASSTQAKTHVVTDTDSIR